MDWTFFPSDNFEAICIKTSLYESSYFWKHHICNADGGTRNTVSPELNQNKYFKFVGRLVYIYCGIYRAKGGNKYYISFITI